MLTKASKYSQNRAFNGDLGVWQLRWIRGDPLNGGIMGKSTALGKGLGLITSITTALIQEIKAKDNEREILDIPDKVVTEVIQPFIRSVSEAAEFYSLLAARGPLVVDLSGLTPTNLLDDFEAGIVERRLIRKYSLPATLPRKIAFFVLHADDLITDAEMLEKMRAGGMRSCEPWELMCLYRGLLQYQRYIHSGDTMFFVALQDRPLMLVARKVNFFLELEHNPEYINNPGGSLPKHYRCVSAIHLD